MVRTAGRVSGAARVCRFAVAAFALFLASVPSAPARADAPPVPASDYPSTTRIQYFPNWSNRQYDCNFGWNCETDSPFLHVRREDDLHRVSGWAMWGHWHDDIMGFELYSSVYSPTLNSDGVPWNDVAERDEGVALTVWHHATAAKTLPDVLPPGVAGKTAASYVNEGAWHVLFLTVSWGGTHEVEGAALFPMKRKYQARRFLIRQVRAAVLASSDPAPGT